MTLAVLDRFSPYMRRALQLMIDGEWHSEEVVVREMIKLIPPGPAMRRAEARRAGQRTTATWQTPAERVVPRSADFLRVVGSRHIALDALKHSKRVERRSDAEGRWWVRIRPDELPRLQELLC